MVKPVARSTLYRLIEAGQLARHSLLVPLIERGLEPGDDAVLFALGKQGATENQLAGQIGETGEPFILRIARLIEQGVVIRQAVGSELAPGLVLTERGDRIRAVLADNWSELENALFGELPEKRRRHLRRNLKRFIALLRL